MANEVYANGREISCKSGDGKVIAAMPDVCFTPPENPATPPGVPVPYPISSFSSDDSEGTKNVLINGKEVMLRNISYFKKCVGDEAGAAAKKGMITSSNMSKTYFKSWSMDVKFEGENVVRHLDITTSNHQSDIGNESVTFPEIESQAFDRTKSCEDYKKDEDTRCAELKPHPSGKGLDCRGKAGKACQEAKACILVPKDKDKTQCCSPATTGHHLIEVHCFAPTGATRPVRQSRGNTLHSGYDSEKAPCACATTKRSSGSHGTLHAVQRKLEAAYNQRAPIATFPGAGRKLSGGGRGDAESKWSYGEARDCGARAHKIANPHCNEECIKKQLDEYHKDKAGLSEDSPLRSDPQAGSRSAGSLKPPQDQQAEAAANAVRGVTAGTFG